MPAGLAVMGLSMHFAAVVMGVRAMALSLDSTIVGPMRRNPFIDFSRHAEALGDPALLVISLGCLYLVVGAVGLLAVWQSGWAFALAVCSLFVAAAILSAAMVANLNEADEA